LAKCLTIVRAQPSDDLVGTEAITLKIIDEIGLSLRRSVVGWRSKMRDAMGLRPALTSTPKRPLPFYLSRPTMKALFSWLMRLATRMGVSMHALASCSFGIDDRFGHTRCGVASSMATHADQ